MDEKDGIIKNMGPIQMGGCYPYPPIRGYPARTLNRPGVPEIFPGKSIEYNSTFFVGLPNLHIFKGVGFIFNCVCVC